MTTRPIQRDTPQQVSSAATVTRFIDVFVRVTGVVLLLAGVWIGLQVIFEAWGLYRDPRHIEQFAKAVAAGSNLDRVLAAAPDPLRRMEPGQASGARAPSASEDLRLSYFAAWGIVITMLLIVARLAMMAVKTGAELALREIGSRKRSEERGGAG